MNPIYVQVQTPENKNYIDAVQKFLEAADAFKKLTQQQKIQFCQNMQVASFLWTMAHGGQNGEEN